jgi:hypothetical protein
MFLNTITTIILDEDDAEPPPLTELLDDLINNLINNLSEVYFNSDLLGDTIIQNKAKITSNLLKYDGFGLLDPGNLEGYVFENYFKKESGVVQDNVAQDNVEDDTFNQNVSEINGNNSSEDQQIYFDFSDFVTSYLLGKISLSDYFMVGNVDMEGDSLLMTAYLTQSKY